MKTFTMIEVFFIKLRMWACIESNKLHILFLRGIFSDLFFFFFFSEQLLEAYLERSGTYKVEQKAAKSKKQLTIIEKSLNYRCLFVF